MTQNPFDPNRPYEPGQPYDPNQQAQPDPEQPADPNQYDPGQGYSQQYDQTQAYGQYDGQQQYDGQYDQQYGAYDQSYDPTQAYGQPYQDPYQQPSQPGYGQPGYDQQAYEPTQAYDPAYPTDPAQAALYPPGESTYGYDSGYQYAGYDQTAAYPQGQVPPGYGQPPFGQAGPAQQPKNKWVLPVAIGVGVVVAALVFFLVFNPFSGKGDPTGGPTESATAGATEPATEPASEPPANGGTAQEAVEGYYAALQSGNAAAALAYAQTQPTDTTFLTDTVLQRAISSLSDLKVTMDKDFGEDSSYASANVSYTLNNKRIQDDYVPMTKVDGQWLFSEGYGTLKIEQDAIDLGVTIAGVKPPTAGDYPAFMGVYDVALDNPLLTLEGDASQAVIETLRSSAYLAYFSPKVSEEGNAKFIEAAQAKLKSCLKQKSLAPEGCGFSISEGSYKIDTSTIKWKHTSGDLKKAEFSVSYSDVTLAKAYVYMKFEVTAKTTSGESVGSRFLSPSFSSIQVDFSDPNNLAVTFS
ncbi:MAG: hypothetical protein LBR21_07185 [Propionibacteriaceae bacterium]|jgi:hypothetical protein|nr:hypothetical protein [Propionibacteriaceae bacterium]